MQTKHDKNYSNDIILKLKFDDVKKYFLGDDGGGPFLFVEGRVSLCRAMIVSAFGQIDNAPKMHSINWKIPNFF